MFSYKESSLSTLATSFTEILSPITSWSALAKSNIMSILSISVSLSASETPRQVNTFLTVMVKTSLEPQGMPQWTPIWESVSLLNHKINCHNRIITQRWLRISWLCSYVLLQRQPSLVRSPCKDKEGKVRENQGQEALNFNWGLDQRIPRGVCYLHELLPQS